MFTNYVQRVIETYQLKKEKGGLSLNLTEPTPSRLKSECMIVYAERFKEKDHKALRLFFQTKEDTTDYSLSIRNIDTDKFKPLANFLKGRTSETDGKNIELLSWLIDFEPRPYDHRNKYEELPAFDPGKPDEGKDIKGINDEGELRDESLEEDIELKTKDFSNDDEENGYSSDQEEVNGQFKIESLGKEDFSNPDSGNSEDSEKQNGLQFHDNEVVNNGGGINEPISGENERDNPEEEGQRFDLKKILIGIAIAASIVLGGYFFLNGESDDENTKQENRIDSSAIQEEIKITPTDTIINKNSQERKKAADERQQVIKIADIPEEKCMYWNEDHYQKIFCDDKNITGPPVTFDKELQENFRKITFPDTITLKSEGKIWYSKSDGKYEYFTGPGKHPVNNKPLRRITDYIIKTHILKN
ncbi:hypothetical protein [Chryseobacterium tongliaoense]|uniref:hypothetical protein n=1 Tax=Chryseobacterium tongliaoense TaxID=3240933 RepID=UPI0035165804